jgi:N-methylhydantoinase B
MSWVVGAERFYSPADGNRQVQHSPALPLHQVEPDFAVDLVTFEVVSHRLWQICDEMGATLRKVSGSPVATEASDFATMIADETGAGVYMGPYVLNHAVVLEDIIGWTINHRVDNPGIAANDMFLCNDPWVGAAHQNDVAVYAPLFLDGELFAWTGTTIHQVDVGGPSPGSFTIGARDIFGEGSPLPPVKIMRDGVLQSDIEDLYIRRSRQPAMLQLDLRAQIAANNVAQARLRALCEKFGADAVKTVMQTVMDRTESALRQRLGELPDGTWKHVDNIEVAGAGDRSVYQVRCAMTKCGTDLHFDFTGTDPQIGMINGGSGAAMAGIMAALLPMLAGDQTWASGAIRRLITLTNPRGTLINAEYPAACSIASTSAICIVHNCTQATVAKMLSTHPEHRRRLLAGGGGSWPAMQVMGRDQFGRAFVTQFQEPTAMGWGARSWADGVNTAGPYAIPAARNGNVETTEMVWPILVLYRREVTDTGGAGYWRGGLGGNFAFVLHGTTEDFIHVSAAACVAFPGHGGLSGGCPGSACRYLILRKTDARALLRDGRLPTRLDDLSGQIDLLGPKSETSQGLEDVYEITFYGGAGYGDPLDRPADKVLTDICEGAVSREAALAVYGVVLKSDSNEIDTDATAARKDAIRRQRLGGISPPNPVSAAWLQDGGESGTAISEYVAIREGRTVCTKCGHDICHGDENYKLHLAVREFSITELSPLNRDPSEYVDDDIVCRAFYCPGCATQNELEVTDRTQPPIWDCKLDLLD